MLAYCSLLSARPARSGAKATALNPRHPTPPQQHIAALESEKLISLENLSASEKLVSLTNLASQAHVPWTAPARAAIAAAAHCELVSTHWLNRSCKPTATNPLLPRTAGAPIQASMPTGAPAPAGCPAASAHCELISAPGPSRVPGHPAPPETLLAGKATVTPSPKCQPGPLQFCPLAQKRLTPTPGAQVGKPHRAPDTLHECSIQQKPSSTSQPQLPHKRAKMNAAASERQHLLAHDSLPRNDSCTVGMELNPRDEAQLEEAMAGMHAYLARSYAESTSKQDHGSHWNWWTKWCNVWRTAPTRQYHHYFATMKQMETEIFLEAAAVPWILTRMTSRGRDRPLPSSAVAVIRGMRRVHTSKGYQRPPLDMVNQVLKGLCDEYLELHGPESLQPHRKEPFKRSTIAGLMDWYPKNILDECFANTLCMATALLTQSGLRKAEIASMSRRFTKKCMSRASVAWVIDGVTYTEVTPDLIRSMVAGRDYAMVTPPPSKSDRFGVVWGNAPIYLVFNPAQDMNAATWLAKLEIALPVFGLVERRDTPLLTMADGKPPSPSQLDGALKKALAAILPAQQDHHSWHSFRIHFACSLKAAGCQDSDIMLLCRWQTVDSLRLYARINAQDYINFLDQAQRADVDQLQAANWPAAAGGDWQIELDDTDAVSALAGVRISE